MFRAVRDWWSGGRGKVSVRLFLFEFLVVVAGVLVAQELASWNDRRQLLAALEATREKTDREVAFHHAVAVGWKRAVPCLNQRMTDLMRQLGSGQPVDSPNLTRPTMEGGNLQLPGDEQRLLLTEQYGADRAQDYWAASQNVSKLSDSVTDMIRAWSGFAIVDPANGAVSALDRHEARLAAGRVKAALRALDISAGNVIGRARALGIEPNAQNEFRLIADCDDLWRNGMTHPNPDMR